MTTQAPIDYVKTYYETRLQRRRDFPQARQFYEAQLKNVTGDRVVNLGCGPQFYDDLRHFGSLPKSYLGLDLNQQNLEFLKSDKHPELQNGKDFTRKNDVQTLLICGDILDTKSELGLEQESIDCAVSIGFLGIFTEIPFKAAVRRVRSWLAPGGRLVNLSWCNNQQDQELYQGRLKYGFNHPNNPGHEQIVDWATDSGLTLTHEAVFDVPDPTAYGWRHISSTAYQC